MALMLSTLDLIELNVGFNRSKKFRMLRPREL